MANHARNFGKYLMDYSVQQAVQYYEKISIADLDTKAKQEVLTLRNALSLKATIVARLSVVAFVCFLYGRQLIRLCMRFVFNKLILQSLQVATSVWFGVINSMFKSAFSCSVLSILSKMVLHQTLENPTLSSLYQFVDRTSVLFVR
jgi:hypothetical protein